MNAIRCQSGKSCQTCTIIQIGNNRNCTRVAQFSTPRRLAGQGKHPEMCTQKWQQTQTNIAASDDQQAWLAPFFKLFFHAQDCMTFQVTVTPSGRQFSCEADETVLSAALRAGVGLPYGCKTAPAALARAKSPTAQSSMATINNAPCQTLKKPKACLYFAALNRNQI